MAQSKNIKTNKSHEEILFPGTNEKVIVNVTKDQSGRMFMSECIFPSIDLIFSEIKGQALAMINADSEYRYDLMIPKITTMEIHQIPRENDDWNYEKAKSVLTLLPDQIILIRRIIMKGFSSLMKMIEKFHTDNKNRHQATPPDNDIVGKFLRVTGDHPIKNLRDVINLYFATNSQSYFDVLMYLQVTNTYTFRSLFAITGLYHGNKNRIMGSDLLESAIRKVSNGRFDEIHTTNGFLISYEKAVKIQVPPRKPFKNEVKVEAILKVDDDLGPENIEQSKSSAIKTPEVLSSGQKDIVVDEFTKKKNIYLETQNFRLLTFEGHEMLNQVYDELATCGNDEEIKGIVDNIGTTDFLDLIKCLQVLKHPKLKHVLTMIKPHICEARKSSYCARFIKEDGIAQEDLYLEMIDKYLSYFLALLDVTPKDGDSTILKRVLTENVFEITSELIPVFLGLF